MRKLSYLIALVESLILCGYAASLLITAYIVDSKVGSPVVETIIYLVFAGLIFLVGRGVNLARSWARTPYFLMQIFIGIAAYTLLAGTDIGYRVAGLLVGLISLVGLVAIFRTPIDG